jgi:nucleotide-binding universal stress UspA family protein
MSEYRSVLVHVSDSTRSRDVLACATRVSAALGAGLRAVHAVEPLHVGAYLSPETATIAAQLSEEAERERLARARAFVVEASATSGQRIPFESPGIDPVEALLTRSHTADLMLLGQPTDDDADGPSRRLVSRLLVGAGCPLLLIPATGPITHCGTRVLVAWSATRECARAVRDALPLLQRASAVEVMRLGSPASDTGEPLDAVADYLRVHGISATFSARPVREISFGERLLTPTGVDASIGELLLSHAADMDADLLVMGGYGHTRAFELVLGGVTRTVLTSMTLPVLMSH